ncbi:cytochrome P450 3A40-like [Myripristis murdjan]|uniref:cytochrome P450 3A40-like n=1 Tax=Myripristis murdjan TaxID=586833 RepID=UPI001176106F|nr:cytochrome P450 3A40-like [Myripristis murdjan]
MGFLPFFSLETWALLVMFISLFIMYGYWSYGVFEKLGIPCPKPIMYWGTVTKGHSVYYIKDYMSFKQFGKVWGMYELRTPMLAVMDVSMLKTILVKECFSLFPNRRNLRLNGDLYDIVSLSEDDNWRRIRNILTPAFTTGRIKEMFEIMKQHSRKLTDSLRPKAHNEEVINVKDFLGAYSLDAMASCAYSIDTDTIKDPSHPFINHAKKLLRISIPLFLIQGFFPFLLPLLEISGFSLFPKSCVAYFKSVLEKVRAERRGGSHQTQMDFLQLMMNSQQEKQNKGLSDHEIMSQAIIFVAAGFDTSGTTLAFLAYNLAKNPEVMRRLQEEIDTTFPSKAPVQYEGLVNMEYLDSVVSESLRLYPPIARIERVAKATVEINGITVPKDMIVTVPVYALHRDPDLWPDPEEFKPDRFSKENKQSINPYAYLPFGIGPRNCIGMRFALVMVKLALVEVLQNYSFSICKETEIPLEMDPTGLLGPLRPIKLKLVARSIASANVDN